MVHCVESAEIYFTDVIADSAVRCKRGVIQAIEEPCIVGVILVGQGHSVQ
jgi:hypothetical protein